MARSIALASHTCMGALRAFRSSLASFGRGYAKQPGQRFASPRTLSSVRRLAQGEALPWSLNPATGETEVSDPMCLHGECFRPPGQRGCESLSPPFNTPDASLASLNIACADSPALYGAGTPHAPDVPSSPASSPAARAIEARGNGRPAGGPLGPAGGQLGRMPYNSMGLVSDCYVDLTARRLVTSPNLPAFDHPATRFIRIGHNARVSFPRMDTGEGIGGGSTHDARWKRV